MVRLRENVNQRERQITQPQTETQKLLEEMKGYLKGPKWLFCIKGREEQDKKILYERIGTNTLSHWPDLFNHYQNEPDKLIILNDLKARLEKVKSNELPDYNRKMAYYICDCLVKKEC